MCYGSHASHYHAGACRVESENRDQSFASLVHNLIICALSCRGTRDWGLGVWGGLRVKGLGHPGVRLMERNLCMSCQSAGNPK